MDHQKNFISLFLKVWFYFLVLNPMTSDRHLPENSCRNLKKLLKFNFPCQHLHPAVLEILLLIRGHTQQKSKFSMALGTTKHYYCR